MTDNIKPLVSILLPLYNSEKYIASTIRSLVNQTYSNIEILIIDDGSTDRSYQIASEAAKLFTNIQVYTRENRGLVTTLNELIRIAKGDFYARIDADDLMVPDRIMHQINLMITEKLDLLGSAILKINEFDQSIDVFRYPESDAEIKLALTYFSPFAHPSVMIRGDFIKKHNLRYDPVFSNCEDYELWTRIALLGGVCKNSLNICTYYRIHSLQKSITTKLDLLNEFKIIQHTYINKLGFCNIYILLFKTIISKNFFKNLLKIIYLNVKNVKY